MIQSKAEALAIAIDTNQVTKDREDAIHYLSDHALQPEEIEILVSVLDDDKPGVRWAASTALATRGTAALPALLRALMRPDSNTLLRASAHHVLHDNVDYSVRKQAEGLLKALRGPAADVAAMDVAGQWLQQLTALA